MSVGPLARLLSALSAECDDLAVRVDEMQRFLPQAGAKAGGRLAVDSMVAAQDIDYVQQHLAALSEFMMVFAEMTPASFLVDLDAPLRTIRLAALKHRLGGTSPDEDANQVRPGELELL